MNASDAATVDELLLVAEDSVEFLFGTGRAALLQISSPLSTSESKAWLSSQNVDANFAKVDRACRRRSISTHFRNSAKNCSAAEGVSRRNQSRTAARCRRCPSLSQWTERS